MNNNNFVILDLDDTLLDLESELVKVYPELSKMTPDKRLSNRHNVLQIIEENDVLRKVKKYNTVDNLINYFQLNNLKIKIITARGWLPNSWEVTQHNLNENNIPYDELIICDLAESKTKYLNNKYNYICSVEDNPFNHDDFVNSGQVLNSYCIMRPAYSYPNGKNFIDCLSQIYEPHRT